MTFDHLRDGVKLAVTKDGETRLFNERGVKSLLGIVESGDLLLGADVEDIVVGKAAAMLMICGGVRRVKAGLISEPALAAFERHGVFCEFNEITPHIINRRGDGVCPMEETVIGVDDPHEAYLLLKEKLKSM